jgi:hypothetical protein
MISNMIASVKYIACSRQISYARDKLTCLNTFKDFRFHASRTLNGSLSFKTV